MPWIMFLIKRKKYCMVSYLVYTTMLHKFKFCPIFNRTLLAVEILMFTFLKMMLNSTKPKQYNIF